MVWVVCSKRLASFIEIEAMIYIFVALLHLKEVSEVYISE